jgi:hypothetical protein
MQALPGVLSGDRVFQPIVGQPRQYRDGKQGKRASGINWWTRMKSLDLPLILVVLEVLCVPAAALLLGSEEVSKRPYRYDATGWHSRLWS